MRQKLIDQYQVPIPALARAILIENEDLRRERQGKSFVVFLMVSFCDNGLLIV